MDAGLIIISPRININSAMVIPLEFWDWSLLPFILDFCDVSRSSPAAPLYGGPSNIAPTPLQSYFLSVEFLCCVVQQYMQIVTSIIYLAGWFSSYVACAMCERLLVLMGFIYLL